MLLHLRSCPEQSDCMCTLAPFHMDLPGFHMVTSDVKPMSHHSCCLRCSLQCCCLLQVKGVDGKWLTVRIPSSVKAIVLLNLQSYGGGRDIWGLADSAKDTRRGWKTPIFNDGMFEVHTLHLHLLGFVSQALLIADACPRLVQLCGCVLTLCTQHQQMIQV